MRRGKEGQELRGQEAEALRGGGKGAHTKMTGSHGKEPLREGQLSPWRSLGEGAANDSQGEPAAGGD